MSLINEYSEIYINGEQINYSGEIYLDYDNNYCEITIGINDITPTLKLHLEQGNTAALLVKHINENRTIITKGFIMLLANDNNYYQFSLDYVSDRDIKQMEYFNKLSHDTNN